MISVYLLLDLVEYVSYRELDRIGRTETCQIGISLVQDVLSILLEVECFCL